MQVSLILTEIADKELLRTQSYSNLSIFNGQRGCAIFFSQLCRVTKNRWYKEFASKLIDNVCQNITNRIFFNFASGLCGIGRDIKLLKSQGLIHYATDEILVYSYR